MRRGRRTSALASAALLGMAACTVAVPGPRSAPPSAASSNQPSAGDAVPSATSASRRLGLRDELDVLTFPRDLSGTTLEFVSDGSAILYSSSRAPDSALESAPDLWRYEPGATEPTLVWHNPERDHSIVRIAGDLGTAAFVDVPTDGERAWNLWLVPEPNADAILLDTHPGDDDVSSLVPSFTVRDSLIAWTSFDRGPDGPVSQLFVASAPSWQPRLLQERHAAEAELWLPSVYGSHLVYTEVRYAPDRSTDERFVYLLDLADPEAEPMRLDTSGRATMPLILSDTVLWKETDPGLNMFTWGRMVACTIPDCEPEPISTAPQDEVNYPSVGERFAAWWGLDSFSFGVYDLERDQPRFIEIYPAESGDNVLRPHVSGSLLVWLFVDGPDPGGPSELRYAYLPMAGGDRLGD
ncbi:MAG TPA: hypothetical protein VFW95_05865 [Candidatus Limnocylindria bacterium]|nr:hypothetical protein [Candidatus Limnocylindria bacterium]